MSSLRRSLSLDSIFLPTVYSTFNTFFNNTSNNNINSNNNTISNNNNSNPSSLTIGSGLCLGQIGHIVVNRSSQTPRKWEDSMMVTHVGSLCCSQELEELQLQELKVQGEEEEEEEGKREPNETIKTNDHFDIIKEIENLVLKGISSENQPDPSVVPEGHRAPVMELLCSRRHSHKRHNNGMKSTNANRQRQQIDIVNGSVVQMDMDLDIEIEMADDMEMMSHGFCDYDEHEQDTPSDETCSSCDISRSETPCSPMPMMRQHTSSPTDPPTIGVGVGVNSSHYHVQQRQDHDDYSSSPKINKFLTREPPDGCEKVKIVNENARRTNFNLTPPSHANALVLPRLLKPSSGFVKLLPSRNSAFLPIPKSNYINPLSNMDSIKNEINKLM